MSIEVIKDSFDWERVSKDKNGIIVNACNTMGVSGAGFALEIKKRFPKEEKEYQLVCDKDILHLGGYFLTDHILFVPTKQHWRDKCTNFEGSYEKYKLNDMMRTIPVGYNSEAVLNYFIMCSIRKFEKRISFLFPETKWTLFMPLLGCGLAGGRPESFLEMMRNEFENYSSSNCVIFDNRKENAEV